ncbi:hypothetical protein ABIC44_000657 [Sphingomonas sp. 1185]
MSIGGVPVGALPKLLGVDRGPGKTAPLAG